MIESVNLSIWFDDGNQNEIELSPMQVLVVLKLLGIQPAENGCISCYSDKTLKQFTEMQGNPLRLVEVQKEK